jgi:hypothetical protein
VEGRGEFVLQSENQVLQECVCMCHRARETAVV